MCVWDGPGKGEGREGITFNINSNFTVNHRCFIPSFLEIFKVTLDISSTFKQMSGPPSPSLSQFIPPNHPYDQLPNYTPSSTSGVRSTHDAEPFKETTVGVRRTLPLLNYHTETFGHQICITLCLIGYVIVSSTNYHHFIKQLPSCHET